MTAWTSELWPQLKNIDDLWAQSTPVHLRLVYPYHISSKRVAREPNTNELLELPDPSGASGLVVMTVECKRNHEVPPQRHAPHQRSHQHRTHESYDPHIKPRRRLPVKNHRQAQQNCAIDQPHECKRAPGLQLRDQQVPSGPKDQHRRERCNPRTPVAPPRQQQRNHYLQQSVPDAERREPSLAGNSMQFTADDYCQKNKQRRPYKNEHCKQHIGAEVLRRIPAEELETQNERRSR